MCVKISIQQQTNNNNNNQKQFHEIDDIIKISVIYVKISMNNILAALSLIIIKFSDTDTRIMSYMERYL